MEKRNQIADLFSNLWRVHLEWAASHIISTVQIETNLFNKLIGNEDEELQEVLTRGRLSYDRCHVELIKAEKSLRAYLLNQDQDDEDQNSEIEEDMKSIVRSTGIVKSTETTTVVSLSLNAVATKAYESLFNMSNLTNRNSDITGLSSPRVEVSQIVWDVVGPSLIIIIESLWESVGINNDNVHLGDISYECQKTISKVVADLQEFNWAAYRKKQQVWDEQSIDNNILSQLATLSENIMYNTLTPVLETDESKSVDYENSSDIDLSIFEEFRILQSFLNENKQKHIGQSEKTSQGNVKIIEFDPDSNMDQVENQSIHSEVTEGESNPMEKINKLIGNDDEISHQSERSSNNSRFSIFSRESHPIFSKSRSNDENHSHKKRSYIEQEKDEKLDQMKAAQNQAANFRSAREDYIKKETIKSKNLDSDAVEILSSTDDFSTNHIFILESIGYDDLLKNQQENLEIKKTDLSEKYIKIENENSINAKGSAFDPTNISKHGKFSYIPNDSLMSYSLNGSMPSISLDSSNPNWSMSLSSNSRKREYITGHGIKMEYFSKDSRPELHQLILNNTIDDKSQQLTETFCTDKALKDDTLVSPNENEDKNKIDMGITFQIHIENSLMESSIATSAQFGENFPLYRDPNDPIYNSQMETYLNQVKDYDKVDNDDDQSIDFKTINNEQYDNKQDYLKSQGFVDEDSESEDDERLFFSPTNTKKSKLTAENLRASNRNDRYDHDRNDTFVPNSEIDDRFAISLDSHYFEEKRVEREMVIEKKPAPINIRPSAAKKYGISTNQIGNKVLADENSVDRSNVERRIPDIVWECPEDISFPTPLSIEGQLNAVAYDPITEVYPRRPLSGSFVYSPPSGHICGAGHNNLKLTFVPEDFNKYQSVNVSGIVSIYVQKGTPILEWGVPKENEVIVAGNPINEVFFHAQLKAELLEPTQIINSRKEDLTGKEFDDNNDEFIYSHAVGVVLERGIHPLNVQYKPSDRKAKNYNMAYASLTAHVGARAPKIVWEKPDNLYYREVLRSRELNAIIDEPPPVKLKPDEIWHAWGRLKYDPPPDTKLDVGTHTLTVHFTPFDPLQFRATSHSVEITIQQIASSLEWKVPPILYEGMPMSSLHLCCKSIIPDEIEEGGTFQYDLPHGTMLNVGSHLVNCTFTPKNSNRFTNSYCSQTIIVAKPRTPALFWAEPDEIRHTEPLSKAQLNARCSSVGVSGKLIYEPPLETVLPAGNNVLKVTFIPDSVAWIKETTTVSIIVQKAKANLKWSEPSALMENRPLHEGILSAQCLNLQGGHFNYRPPKGSVLQLGEHILTCYFTPSDEDAINYDPGEVSVALYVRPKPRKRTTLDWKPDKNVITFPEKLDSEICNAVCKETKGTFQYKPRLGSCLNVGTHELTVKFIPASEELYLESEAKSSITVTKGSAVLKWIVPDELSIMDYGTPITHQILCAYCQNQVGSNVPGAYNYTINGADIPKNTMLDSGSHLINCSFKPSGETNFNIVEDKAVEIYVRRVSCELEWDPPLGIVYPSMLSKSMHLNATCITEQATGSFHYSHKDSDILSVGFHQLFCRYEPDDLINFFGKDISVVIEVEKGQISLEKWHPKSQIIYGEIIDIENHLNAVVDIDDCSFEYSFEVGTILSAGVHEIQCSITAQLSSANNYEILVVKRQIIVKPRQTKLKWNGPLEDIKFGEKLSAKQLTAFLDLDGIDESDQLLLFHPNQDHHTIQYSPKIGTILQAGTHSIFAIFAPPAHCKNRGYSNRIELKITVLKSTPTLEWFNPNPIIYGAPLEETQQNAKVIGPIYFSSGHFDYKQSPGTILPVGKHRLSTTFIPDNSVSLNTVNANVSLDVYKATPVINWDLALSLVPSKYQLKTSDLSAQCLDHNGKKIDGIWTYIPKSGESVGSVGQRELTVEFNLRGKALKNYNKPKVLRKKIKVMPADLSSTGVATYT